MGREAPPLNKGVGTLMEVAEAYHARASEISALIQRAESQGHTLRGGAMYKFRTGELRTFLEATKRTIDLGSRRITLATLEDDYEDSHT